MSVKKLFRPLFLLTVVALTLLTSAYGNTLQWKTRRWSGQPEFKRVDNETLMIKTTDQKSAGAWCSPVIPAKPGTRYFFSFLTNVVMATISPLYKQ